jgi:lipopolysaccharide transport system ATP-binding protein
VDDIAIRVEGLSKRYRIGERVKYKALRDVLTDAVRAPWRKAQSLWTGSNGKRPSEQDGFFWALKDLSFEVHQGEAVGIIGRNGAGKSTLLKLLSRITAPTSGQAEIRGRVGSLLEVGTGFHPELTGRENIFLNGAILGMRKAEITRKFDEIVSFAEVEKFIDTPVKHYSSGMFVRLAFSVAAHLEPEILLVDEVLAVGDAAFQKKCLGKMGDVAEKGRTILFVSHNLTALQSLCSKAVWVDQGHVVTTGDACSVVSEYLRHNLEQSLEQCWDDPRTAPGNDKVRLRRVFIAPEDADTKRDMTVATPIQLGFEYWNYVAGSQLNISIVLYDLQDVCVFNSVSEPSPYRDGLFRSICHIPSNFLNDNTYRVRLLIVKDTSIPLLDIENVATFQIRDIVRDGNWYGKWVGVIRPKFEWSSEVLGTMNMQEAHHHPEPGVRLNEDGDLTKSI